MSQAKWSILRASNQVFELEMMKDFLLENGIDAVVMNKQDSSYQVFGEGELLVKEDCLVLNVVLVKCVQQGMPCPARRSTGPSCLTTFTKVFRLAPERTLVDPALVCPRKRKPHVLQLKDRLGAHRAHILDRILIADVVRALDGVVHMPAPIVLWISTRNRTGDAALRRYCM